MFNKSFLKILIINPMGVITIKKINPITIGETILPSKLPNEIHAQFRIFNDSGLSKARRKNIKESDNDQNLMPPPPNKGQKAIIMKINPKQEIEHQTKSNQKFNST